MTDDPRKELHERNESLDALRGLAASLVLIVHASETYSRIATNFGHSAWLYETTLAVDIGRIGVVLFFLISGFAVANSLRQSDDGIGGFVIRRIFRLYPLFWFSVILAAVFLQSPGPISSSKIAANLTMLPELFGVPQMLGIYWTLETELISYGFAALLFMSGLFNRVRVLAAFCLVLIAVFASMMFGVLPSARILQWQMLPHNLALILWGNLFHLTYTRQNLTGQAPKHADARWQRTLTVLMAILVLSPSFYSLIQYLMHGKPDNLRWGVAYPAAFGFFVIAFFHVRQVPRIFVWLGETSYSTYLLHPFVITLLISMVQRNKLATELVGVPFFVVISLVVTNALAGISFLILEKPAIRLGKKLEKLYRVNLAPSPF